MQTRLLITTAAALALSAPLYAQTGVTSESETELDADVMVEGDSLQLEGDVNAETETGVAATTEDQPLGAGAPAEPEIGMASDSGQVRPVIVVEGVEVTSSQLIGAEVYGGDGAEVGEISNIVFTAAGAAEEAVVDVGGFLGFGAHRVALPFDELKVEFEGEAQTDLRVSVTQTEDQLEAMPVYEEPADAMN